MATVGQIAAEPGASNVIPGRVTLTLDIRHPEDDHRHALSHGLESEARAAAVQRGLGLEWRTVEDQPAVTCYPELTALLAGAVAETGLPVHRLPSGAGRDAVLLSAITSMAMLFVGCAGGISHHADESVSMEDTAVAINVLDRVLIALAGKHHALA